MLKLAGLQKHLELSGSVVFSHSTIENLIPCRGQLRKNKKQPLKLQRMNKALRDAQFAPMSNLSVKLDLVGDASGPKTPRRLNVFG